MSEASPTASAQFTNEHQTHQNTSPVGVSDLARVNLDAAGLTHVGLERSQNEDQFIIATLHRQMVVRAASEGLEPRQWMLGSPEGVLLAVADGISGHGDGDVASAIAVRSVAEYTCNVMPWVDRYTPRGSRGDHPPRHADIRDGLQGAVAQSQARLDRVSKATGLSSRMGTTLTIAYLAWPQMYLAHIGDSRCYLCRKQRLYRLTDDHTVGNQAAKLGVDLGKDSPYGNLLWKALGGGDATGHLPDVVRVALEHDDVLLLCTDGVTRHLSNEQLTAALSQKLSARAICKQLVEQVNAQGGTDNVTAVVARAPASSA